MYDGSYQITWMFLVQNIVKGYPLLLVGCVALLALGGAVCYLAAKSDSKKLIL